ncbi:membrane hypothetical protein [Syntrophobacter sp. SbD1]|nr:membrane hypothetical protein [Syntrophobacter sp. SbD1]
MNISSVFVSLQKIWQQVQQYLLNDVLTRPMAVQLAAGGFALLLAHKAAGAFRSWFERQMDLSGLSEESSDLQKTRSFLKVVRPILAVLFLEIALRLSHHFEWPADGIETLLFLALAMFFVRFLAAPMTNRYWAAIFFVAIWLWAIVLAFHAEDIWTNLGASIYFEIGKVHVSLLTICRASVLLLVLYWLSKNLSIIFRLWLHTGSGLPPATQTLFHKLCTLLLFSASVVIVLHYMGIDLTVFALFGGAVGLGIGFGLQKIFANLVSGFMILADKSIKPGDVIQLGACLVTGFGDNGLNLELRVWINDPQNGLGSVKNELLRGVWRRFKEEGIELPYSEMVLHHKSMPEVRIRTKPED